MNDSSPSALPSPADIVAYWRALGPGRWYEKDAEVDAEIRARFLPLHEAAAAGALSGWEATADGAFALLLLLDQFPRNMFRGDARAFATDPLARGVAGRAITRGFDAAFANPERRFFYLPFGAEFGGNSIMKSAI
jgi:uncharacterized protein (DUF924 family)